MSISVRKTVLTLALALTVAPWGCSDGGGSTVDGPVGDASLARPSWTLEDVQPLSPRTGQTYGLDTFSAKVVVVTLVEGY